MAIEYLKDGYVKLTSRYGIMHKASKAVYSEVICKEKDIYQYEPAERFYNNYEMKEGNLYAR